MKPKYFLLIIPFAFLILFFLVLDSNSTSNKKMIMRKELCEKMLNYIDESDSESLTNMFSSYDLGRDNSIRDGINKLMSHLGGNIDSIKEIRDGGEQISSQKHKITKFCFSTTISDIITDDEKSYEIVFGYTMINKDYPEQIGVNYITFVDNQNNQLIKIGWE